MKKALLTLLFAGLSFPAYAQCYDSTQVDGHHDAYVAGHSSLIEDRGTYQQTDVDPLVTDLTTGVANSSAACPPPQEPVGPLTDADLNPDAIVENATGPIGITLAATDPNPEDTRTFSLVDDLGGKLAAHLVTGVVTAASAFNFEVTPSFQVMGRVTSSDGSFSDATFTVTVLDVEPEISGFHKLLADANLPNSGDGFTDNPPTATLNDPFYTPTGGWPPVDWLEVNDDAKYHLAQGTYSAWIFVEKWKEFSVANKRLDGIDSPPGWFDFQIGGGGQMHPRINGVGTDEDVGVHGATFCQWIHFSFSFGAGQNLQIYINGLPRYQVPYTGGIEGNTAQWVIGGNRRIHNGRINHAHPFGGVQFEPVVFEDRLDDTQVNQLYTQQAAPLPGTHHRQDVSGSDDPFGTKIPDTAFYDCDNDPMEFVPASVDGVVLAGIESGTDVVVVDPVPDVDETETSDPIGLPKIAIDGIGALAFAPGDLPAGMNLRIDDDLIQVDAKAFHPDGTVRHAAVMGNGAGQLELVAKASCSPFDRARELAEDWDFFAEINGTRIYPRDLLKRDLENNRLDVWRSCPLVSEYRVQQAIGTVLATFDIKASDEGTEVRVTLDAPKDQKIKYRFPSRSGSYAHWGQARASWVFNAHEGFVRHSPSYLTRTGAAPRFDTTLDITVPNYSPVVVGPMEAPLHQLNMKAGGQTKGRHIGLMPLDSIRFLLKPTPGLLNRITAYADGANSIGWFGGSLRRTGGWTVDKAHQPAFYYSAYLFTGERVYYEGLAAQANYSTDGNLLDGQVRGAAWDLRTVANAAYILPDNHPQKQFFAEQLNDSMIRFHRDYVQGGAGTRKSGEIEGFHPKCLSNKKYKGDVNPWQDDYIVLVLAWMTEMNVPLAKQNLEWKSNFTFGRFEAHEGWHPYMGANYRFQAMPEDLCRPDKTFSRWADIEDAGDHKSPNIRQGHAHRAASYADLSFGAVKYADLMLETPRGAAAVAFITDWFASVPNSRRPKELPGNPKWAIARRMDVGS